MSTKKQYEDSARNFAIGIVVLFLVIVFLMIGNRLKAQTTGYFVVVTVDKKTEIIKTADKQQVLNLIDTQFPGVSVDFEQQINRTKQPTFEIYNGSEGIYVEKKRIVGTRKNGQLKMRRLVNR